MKEFLSRTGKAFTVRYVDEDEQAYTDLVALGFRAVPVTVVGNVVLKGFDPDALTKALGDAD